jgi:hypothetical protein
MLGGVNFIYVSDWVVLGNLRLTSQIQAAIIPKEELFTPGGIDVGLRFTHLTLGHTGLNDSQLKTFWTTLKAITVLGNLIVTTFTAARGKGFKAKSRY